jgi:aflatoxin B1 aldehyde reductase
MSRPNIIFGTATVGMGFNDVQTVSELLDFLMQNNINHIDTAGRYPPLNPGLSETLLGQADAAQKGFVLDTKILAGPGDGSGELASSAIQSSLSTSLQRLNIDSVRIIEIPGRISPNICTDESKINVLHCHRPDPLTPLPEQAATLDQLYRQGGFKSVSLAYSDI